MPVIVGKDFQTAMIYRPRVLEISQVRHCRPQVSQPRAPKPCHAIAAGTPATGADVAVLHR
jgi:hypothetical protein